MAAATRLRGAARAAMLAAGLLTLMSASLAAQAEHRTRVFKFLMGTSMRVEIDGGDETQRQQAAEEAFAAIAEVDRLMSSYRPDSELRKATASARVGPVPVSAPLFAVLAAGQRLAAASGGAFSLTTAARDNPRLILDAASRTLRVTGPVTVSADGLAKGFAAELAAGSLSRRGLSGTIDTSGTQFMVGAPPGRRTWSVGIAHPLQRGSVLGAIDVDGGAVATVSAATALRDPRTGQLATAALSATVVSPDGAVADALSKAVFVLGPTDGLALLATYPGTWGVVAYRLPDGAPGVSVSAGHTTAFHPHTGPR